MAPNIIIDDNISACDETARLETYLPQARALVFDCDGTLLDTMPIYYQSWKRTCDEVCLEYIDALTGDDVDDSKALTPRTSSRKTFTDDDSSSSELLEIVGPASSSLLSLFSTSSTSPSRSARTTLVYAPPDENLPPVLEREIFLRNRLYQRM